MGSMAIQGDQKPEATETVRRNGCLFWLGRGLLAAGILLLGVALASAGIEAAAARTDRRTYLPPGQAGRCGWLPVTYPLPGRRQPHCHPGERRRRGLADVGLDPAPAGCQHTWYALTTAPASAGARTVRNLRDAQQIVNELHLLLQNAGVQPPYLLAGHSLGGELTATRMPASTLIKSPGWY